MGYEVFEETRDGLFDMERSNGFMGFCFRFSFQQGVAGLFD